MCNSSIEKMSVQTEDVYETEDLPEDEQHLREEESTENSEEVERIHIDMETALKRFKGRMVNADHVDFSDSIARKRRTGYGSGAYVLEVVGPSAEEEETVEQKFNRLNYELIELAEAVKEEREHGTDKQSVVKGEDVIEMLETIRTIHLSKTSPQQPTDVAKGTETAPAPSETGMSSSAKSGLTGDDNRLVVLENRLKRLERFVCGGCDTVDDLTKKLSRVPLAETMEDLRMRVQLLHPTHVDGLHSRINQVLAKLKQVEEKKLEKTDSDFEEKVSNLYELMSKWDNTCVGLPSAVQRIHGLQKLHEQAQQFSTRLSQLVGVRAQLVKSMESEQMAMFDFRQQAHEAIDKLNSDIQKINERIEKIKM